MRDGGKTPSRVSTSRWRRRSRSASGPSLDQGGRAEAISGPASGALAPPRGEPRRCSHRTSGDGMETPDIRITWSDGFSIAYQITGSGTDLVYLPGWASNLIANRWVPEHARFLDRLSSFARLIVMDRRGVGVADRLPPGSAATLEELVDDVLAVMDASFASRETVLFG